MGDFKIEITATGGHGCSREAKPGDKFYGCGKMGCPDCEFKRFLAQPQFRAMVQRATFTHWPGAPHEVVDEYTLVSDGQYVQARRIKGEF